ncbi:MAG: HAMP domain-containing histidine kinase [Hahellaceae bacterium]|nr:HAMP domain-containing histidine kinase [Hahellaceae bacterium]
MKSLAKKPDFAMVMASAVHDMKNSLSMLLHSLETIVEELPPEMRGSGKMATLQYEAERVNNDLIQLLGIYRLQDQSLGVHVEEHYVSDFLDEQVVRYELLFNARNIDMQVDCDRDLVGYFDRDLIAGILNNTLTNAARYTQDKIALRAFERDGWLVIEIDDNGRGYPKAMLDAPGEIQKGIDFDTGSTSLGLYFASQVAYLHQQAGKQGFIELENGGEWGGGVFRIALP